MNKKELISHLRKQGFSEAILKGFKKVKREDFIPKEYKKYAYCDGAVPIGCGATISQPYTIAFMLDLLELNKKLTKVLEIGSGSGYVLALLSKIVDGKIYGVEIIKELAEKSKGVLRKNKKIKVINKSGFNGLPEYASFDRILISASAPNEEAVLKLKEQLKENGIIVASVGNKIIKIKKVNDNIEKFYGFAFVHLIED